MSTTATSDVINLPGAADGLLRQARVARSGRAARTLVPGAGAPLKQTLLALTKGAVLADHESPGHATIQVLQGRIRLTAEDQATELVEGEHTSIPQARHGVEALEDAVALITVATAPTA